MTIRLKITNLKSIRQFQNHVLDTRHDLFLLCAPLNLTRCAFPTPRPAGRCWIMPPCHSPREKVAVVGLNGSGKSTLIKLLLRFYELDSGVIRVNGVDIREYPILELRKHFSAYFQDEQSYSFTLLENLTIADPDHRTALPLRSRRFPQAAVMTCCSVHPRAWTPT